MTAMEFHRLLTTVRQYPTGHFLRTLVESDLFVPGWVFLRQLYDALVTLEPFLKEDQQDDLLNRKLRAAGAGGNFDKDSLYSSLFEVTVLSSAARVCSYLAYEPRVRPGSTKNVEGLAIVRGINLEIEAKCPALFDYTQQFRTLSASNLYAVNQYLTRTPGPRPEGGDTVLPQDNRVKDFLVSADEKFSGTFSNTRTSLLFIAWSHDVGEPLQALLGRSGLLTSDSFARRTYPNIGGIVVSDSYGLFNDVFARPNYRVNPLAFTQADSYFIQNPAAPDVPEVVWRLFAKRIADQRWVRSRVPEWIMWPLHSSSVRELVERGELKPPGVE